MPAPPLRFPGMFGVLTWLGKVGVSILKLRILVAVPQLTLHAGIATLVLLVLLNRTLA